MRHHAGTCTAQLRSLHCSVFSLKPGWACFSHSLFPWHVPHWATDSSPFAQQSPAFWDPQSRTSRDGRSSYAHADSEGFSKRSRNLGEGGHERAGLHAENPKTLRSLCPEVPGNTRPKLASMPTFSPRSLETCLLSFTSHLFPSIIFSTSAEACWGRGQTEVKGAVRRAHRPTCGLTPEIRVVESVLIGTPLCI